MTERINKPEYVFRIRRTIQGKNHDDYDVFEYDDIGVPFTLYEATVRAIDSITKQAINWIFNVTEQTSKQSVQIKKDVEFLDLFTFRLIVNPKPLQVKNSDICLVLAIIRQYEYGDDILLVAVNDAGVVINQDTLREFIDTNLAQLNS